MKKLRTKVTPHTRMQQFGLFFFDHFKTTLILWILLVLIGGLSYTTFLKRDGFPPFEFALTTVTGTYFVNDAERVDREVVEPLTELIQKQTGVKDVTASAGSDFYILQVEFPEGTDAVAASQRLEAAAKSAQILPKNATAEFAPVRFGVDPDNQGDDLLVAFFAKQSVATETLDTKMHEAVRFLQRDEELAKYVERVRAVDLYRSGTNPRTNVPIRQQKAFDRLGQKNGELRFYQAGEIAFKARPGVDQLHLFDRTEEALGRLRQQATFRDYDVAISANQAEGIRSQISSLQENLLGGLVAVIVVSFLLVSLRASLVTAVAMVSVLAVTLVMLLLTGQTLNTITLFSLILCLGLIVDDTIIMVEAIDAGRAQRRPKRAIVAQAIKKVGRASVTGTITTMLGFAPLLFIGGFLGDVIWVIPLTIIISLAVSLLVSQSLVPFWGRFLLGGKPLGTGGFNPVKRLEAFVSSRLASALYIGKRSRPKLTILAVLAVLFSLGLTAAGGLLFSRLSFNIFPPAKDADALVVSMQFPENTTIAAAQTAADEIHTMLAKEIGSHITQASLYATGKESSATLTAQLTPYKERDIKATTLAEQVETRFKGYPKATVTAAPADVGPPPGLFTARIFYDDRSKAQELAKEVHGYLQNREFKRLDGSTFRVEQVRITPGNEVLRQNGRRYLEVQASFNGTDTTALVTIAQNAVEQAFPADRLTKFGLTADALQFDFGAESDNQESFRAMLVAFPVLLVIMYVLLAVQFRSMLQPFLIFLALPFSVFGIALGLYLTDNPFSFFTMIGVFALIGISVNNTILLTDFANQAQAAGKRRLDAIASAVQARFRPLLTTSLTSVVALVPLAISDPFWESLAVTLIFGLLSSTFLVIIAFPYYYLSAEFLRIRFSRGRVLGWLAAFVVGTFALTLSENGYYLPLWWLICMLIMPVHIVNKKLIHARKRS